MTEADEELVVRSQQEDRAAFEELVRRTARAVFARIHLATGRHAEAEDLVQETFLRAWRSIRQMTDPGGFRPWLFSIAAAVVIDAARRDGRRKRAHPRGDSAALAQQASTAPAPPEVLLIEERRQRVLQMLRDLPEEYRAPLVLRYLGGADYQTIGRQLGLSDGSLRGFLSRGMAMLRQKMKEE